MNNRPRSRLLPLLVTSLLFLTAWVGAPKTQAAACQSAASGAWEDPLTWTNCNGSSPGSGDSAQIMSGHTVTLGGGADAWWVGSTTVDSGGTLIVTRGIRNGSAFAVEGALVIGNGGWVENVSPTYGSSAMLRYGNDSTYGLGMEWPATGGPNNVDVANGSSNGLNMNGASRTVSGLFQTNGPVTNGSLTIGGTGTLQINGGGWLAFAPTYGSGSLLKYNSADTYGRNNEWSATSGAGYPYNVQLSNNTTLDLGNGGAGTARQLAGSLTIDSGSTLSMDINQMTQPLRVLGGITINGTLVLSGQAGGDIEVGGNWTNNGTFTGNSRRVTFNGSGVQSVGGSVTTTFDYLLVDNLAGGDVTLAANITVRREFKINDGDARLSAGAAAITMQGDVSNGPVWINNGTFNRGTGTVAWTGENNQHGRVLGSAVTTFNNVTLSRNAGGSNNFGVDFYDHDTASRAHIAGTLTLNQYAFVASEEDGSSTSCAPSSCDGTPIYDAGSTLRYSNSGSFASAAEWWPEDADPLCGADKGMPYNVVFDNSTTVNINAAFGNNGQAPNYGASSNKAVCGAVTINSGSTLQATAGRLSVKGNWTNSGGFTHNSGLVRFNGASTIGGTVATSFYDILIDSGCSVTGSAAGTINVAHNWTNNGTFTASTSTVVCNGSTAQVLGGTSTTTFYNLTIQTSSAATVSLGHDQALTAGLRPTSGQLILGVYNLWIDGSGGISIDPATLDATRMVVADSTGSLCYEFGNHGMNWIFIYPVGDNTGTPNYSRLRLSFPGGTYTWGYACVRVTDIKHPNNPSATDYLTRYWTITNYGITGYSARVIVYYIAGAEDVAGTESNILAMRWTNGAWIYGPAVNTTTHSYQWDGVNSFGDFTGGTYPTAVDLVSFGAAPRANGVLLSWETASELDNVGFYLYRSTSFNSLGEQLNSSIIPSRAPGSGEGAYYEFLDLTALPGVAYYYTLEDVDASGGRTAHGPVSMALWRVYLPVVR